MVPIDSTDSANSPACLHFQYFGFFFMFTTEILDALLNVVQKDHTSFHAVFLCDISYVIHRKCLPSKYYTFIYLHEQENVRSYPYLEILLKN
jgi:hypothetical protein